LSTKLPDARRLVDFLDMEVPRGRQKISIQAFVLAGQRIPSSSTSFQSDPTGPISVEAFSREPVMNKRILAPSGVFFDRHLTRIEGVARFVYCGPFLLHYLAGVAYLELSIQTCIRRIWNRWSSIARKVCPDLIRKGNASRLLDRHRCNTTTHLGRFS